MKNNSYALLVIDMQQVAFDGKITPPITRGAQLLDSIATLIEGCRRTNTPIIYAQTNAPSGRPYARDVHGWEIHPAVAPNSDELIIFKMGPSGFEDPGLEEALSEGGISELIVCGTWTEGCVSITARGALKRGYRVILAADAHGTVRENWEAARVVIEQENKMLAQRGVGILPVAEILKRLLNN